MSVSFPPTLFFPACGSSASAGAALPADLARVAAHTRGLQAAAAAASPAGGPTIDEQLTTDISVIGKSRLLLQLAYRIASESIDPGASAASAAASVSEEGGVAAPPAAVLGDPFQPVILLLPKARSLEQMSTAAAAGGGGGSSKQKASPLVGLFGPGMRPEVLQKIKIKWYQDDAHLMRLLCGLHLLAAACSSNVSNVPPRFIGVMYDARLSSEAATLAAVCARLTEAVYAINNNQQPFAKCQALLVMSHVSGIGRLKTLLPRYARCVFEITPTADSSGWLLHTRPMVSGAHMSPALLSRLLTPMVGLARSEALLPTHKEISLALTRMPGLPTLKYNIQPDAVECTSILL